ncbi:uncharacterized protein LOC132923279 [Rhopalosiphum padi]|uniref:uncharacterized protein LOC132923279 n=1 Tax=Rhopalosiphum padi TaxID=40932 RepID=UPI00298DC23C|nr:uncharacterized protein LOC132923279 [Rhopalosiphum padi]
MKYILIILTEFLILVDSGVRDFKFRPNLPLGDYRIHFIAIIQCNSNSTIQHNFFLYKTSRNTTDLRGNITSLRAFDDSLIINLKMDIKDKIGNWQSNAYTYKSPQAYTCIKNFLGGEFPKFLNKYGINASIYNIIPPGIYTTKGYDVSNYPENTNFPKQIFYGTYKFNIIYTEKNGDRCGCFTFVIEVKRPWEIE